MVATALTAAPARAADDIRYEEEPVAGWSTDGSVYAVSLIGDVVYVGGSFTMAVSPDRQHTRDRKNLAAFDRITGEVLDFRADTNGAVRGIAGNGTTVWVGGQFTEIGGQARGRLAALNATSGTVRSGFNVEADRTVWHVEHAAGRVYVSGEFNNIDGKTNKKVASLHPITGQPDPDFEARASGTVRSLAYSADRETLYAGGSFGSIGGTSRDYLSGLDPATGDAKGSSFDEPGSIVMDVDVSDDGSSVYAAIGGNRNRAQAWSTSSGNKRWDQKAMGDVQAISYEDDRVYFGFHEGFNGSTSVRLLAAKASNGSLDSSFRPRVNSFYGIWDIDAAPGGLIAGGEFSRIEGVRTKGSAIFPRDGIPDLEPPSRVTGIYALATTATSIDLAWEPARDDVGINGYVVRRDGQVVATAPTAAYLDEDLEPNRVYTYTVEALDSVNRSGGISDPVELETRWRVVESRSRWAYYDDGAPPTNWKGRAFDDSTWSEGPAQLGFGEDDEATELDDGELAYYFRRSFTSPGGREVLAAAIGIVRDDGAVVYLNGTEVMRSNMPEGAIGHNTPAASTTGGADESRWFSVDVDASLFRPGKNVFAVEVHQRTENSSDVSFDLRLEAELSDEPYDSEFPTAPSNLHAAKISASSVRLEWQPAQDNRGIARYVVFRDGAKVGTTSVPSFLDKGLEPDSPYKYKVFAVDTSGNRGPRSNFANVRTRLDRAVPTKPGNLHAVAVTGESVKLKWKRSKDNVAVDHYIVRRDGVTIGTTSQRSYQVSGLNPVTEYHFAVRAVDTSGNRGRMAHLRQSTTQILVRSEPIKPGASWKYLDDGSDQGDSWKQPGFKATTWDTGRAELGYGDGDEVTVVSGGPGNDRHITTYFRKKFTIGDPSAVEKLQIRLVRDDGAVVYLNGVEILRDNMPSGQPDYTTRASGPIAGTEESRWIESLVPLGSLRLGNNTIAVEIHQSGPGSTDISFDLAVVVNPHVGSPM